MKKMSVYMCCALVAAIMSGLVLNRLTNNRNAANIEATNEATPTAATEPTAAIDPLDISERATHRLVPPVPRNFPEFHLTDRQWPAEKGNVWTNLLRDSVTNFVESAFEMDKEKTVSKKERIRYLVNIGITQSDFNNTISALADFYDQKPMQRVHSIVPSAVRAAFRSEPMRAKIYAWAIPAIQGAFKLVAKKDQLIYLAAGDHAVEYLNGLSANYSTEAQYLTDLDRGKCFDPEWRARHGNLKLDKWVKNGQLPCIVYFVSNDPSGQENQYRRVDAFLFRRFNSDGIAPHDLSRWVKRLLADLRPLVKD